MTDALATAASWALIAAGTFFVLVGAVGILRLPDVFARMHAAGMTDTLGAGLVLAGLCFQVEFGLVTVRLLLVILFLWFTSPVATHALARTILHDRAGEGPAPVSAGAPGRPAGPAGPTAATAATRASPETGGAPSKP